MNPLKKRKYNKVIFKKSTKKEKKRMAIFYSDSGNKNTVHFGAAGMSDYTIHKDKERRKNYLVRHKVNENWDNPITPGSLSKFILWGRYTSIDKNINHFKNKFKFK